MKETRDHVHIQELEKGMYLKLQRKMIKTFKFNKKEQETEAITHKGLDLMKI